MYVIYSLRECNYLKRTKIEVIENLHCSLGLLQQTMMISSADHYDLLGGYQAQTYQTVGQQKGLVDLCTMLGCGVGEVRRHLLHPPAYGPECKHFLILICSYRIHHVQNCRLSKKFLSKAVLSYI